MNKLPKSFYSIELYVDNELYLYTSCSFDEIGNSVSKLARIGTALYNKNDSEFYISVDRIID